MRLVHLAPHFFLTLSTCEVNAVRISLGLCLSIRLGAENKQIIIIIIKTVPTTILIATGTLSHDSTLILTKFIRVLNKSSHVEFQRQLMEFLHAQRYTKSTDILIKFIKVVATGFELLCIRLITITELNFSSVQPTHTAIISSQNLLQKSELRAPEMEQVKRAGFESFAPL